MYAVILDYINYHRLQQDHFCVIEMIRKNYLNQPAPEAESLVLRNPQTVDPSAGQTAAILHHLNNEVSVKFIFFLIITGSNQLVKIIII